MQSKIHKITIQKDTFLVTEYEDHCNQTVPTPVISKVKLEKEASPHPQPCPTLDSIHIKKDPELVRRKKDSRQSLVQMLAQCVDENTLKSVILAHEKQKCAFSDSDESSLDSNSDTDSDSEEIDNVDKIFKTIFTIDLCDDDDETLHEDVLQLLNENKDTVDSENGRDLVSMSLTTVEESPTLNPENKQDNIQSRNLSNDEQQMTKIMSDTPEILDSFILTTDKHILEPPSAKENPSQKIVELSENNNSSASTLMNADSNANNKLVGQVDFLDTEMSTSDEVTSFLPTENTAMEVDSNSPRDFNDLENPKEFDEKCDDNDVKDHVSDISKCNDTQGADITERETNVLKQSLDTISDGVRSENCTNEISLNTKINDVIKLSFEDALMQADSVFVENQRKQKRLQKSKENDAIEYTVSKNLIDASQHDGRLSYVFTKKKSVPEPSDLCKSPPKTPPKTAPETASKVVQRVRSEVPRKNVANSVETATESFGKALIKIENECSIAGAVDGKNTDSILNNHEQISNDIPKPSRSRKRKLDKSIEAVKPLALIMENVPTPQRPIFDYFESPEILTTKRARKSKSYTHSEALSADAEKSNPRSTRQRKSNISEMTVSTEDVVSNSEPYTQLRHDTTEKASELSCQTERKEAEKQENSGEVKKKLIPLKTGRGVKPQVLAPINVAPQYTCSNCNEEVVAANWTNHFKSHYALAWRVGVDPPYVS